MTKSTLSSRRIAYPILLCASFCVSLPAWATLGGAVETVQVNQQTMHATRRVTALVGYEIHELVLGSGTLVREFVAPSGTVFGVAWRGPIKPDLNELLGASFPRMVTAGMSPHADHRALRVHASDLVIESGGKMRAFAGRAYLPALVPANVLIGEIQ